MKTNIRATYTYVIRRPYCLYEKISQKILSKLQYYGSGNKQFQVPCLSNIEFQYWWISCL